MEMGMGPEPTRGQTIFLGPVFGKSLWDAHGFAWERAWDQEALQFYLLPPSTSFFVHAL